MRSNRAATRARLDHQRRRCGQEWDARFQVRIVVATRVTEHANQTAASHGAPSGASNHVTWRTMPTMTTESSMYLKVRDFVVDHWNAAEAMTNHDSGPHARGKGIALSFGGVNVEPDVYGIVVSNSVELPILGEGKLKMGGHEGTRAFGQALTYRNLGMLSFLFFPESEFSTAATATFRAMCAQAGIALVMVPPGKHPIEPKRHVVVELAGGHPSDIVGAIDRTLSAIKGIGQMHLADIYPQSLRDVLSLFNRQALSSREIERRFLDEWTGFASVLRARPYDPMVSGKIASGKSAVKREYYRKFIGGLLALGLLAPTTAPDFGRARGRAEARRRSAARAAIE